MSIYSYTFKSVIHESVKIKIFPKSVNMNQILQKLTTSNVSIIFLQSDYTTYIMSGYLTVLPDNITLFYISEWLPE